MASNPFSFVGGGEEVNSNVMEALQRQLAELRLAQQEMLSDLQHQVAALRAEAGNAVGDLETRMGQHLESRLKQTAATETRLTLKPPKPARFTGGVKGPKIHEWLHQAETYLLAAGLEKEQQGVHHIASFLEGDAAIWWRHHCQQQDDGTVAQPRHWKELRKLMTEQFQVFNHETEIRDQYVSLRQTSSVNQYIARFRALVLELPHESEEQKIYFFLRGLKPDIQARTRTHKPKTLARAMDIADEADRAHYHAYRGRRFQYGSMPAADAGVSEEIMPAEGTIDDAPEPVPMDINALTSQQRGGARLRAGF